MATIKTNGALDGTTVFSNLTITVKSRSATSVTFSYSIATGFEYASGNSSANYETYTGKIAISGTSITSKTTTVTLKALSEAWSGEGTHSTKTGTITVDTSSSSNLTATIKYTVTSSQDSSNSNTGSTTLDTGAGTVTPTAPTSVTAKSNVGASTSTVYIGYNADSTITVSCSGGSNISKYRYQVSINSGSYTTLTDSTSSSYSYIVSGRSAGDTIRFRVYAISSTSTLSSSATYSTTLTVKYRTPSKPTNLKFSNEYYLPNEPIKFSWTKPVQTVTGYKVQYRIDGGNWISRDDVTATSVSYSNINLRFRQKIEFRVAAYNASATGDYAVSLALMSVGGILQNVNETYHNGDVYINVDGVWKLGTVYIKSNDEWKVSI